VRNGGNPVTDEVLGREAHFFDGDGMLAGVSFTRKTHAEGSVQPEFVNQYILTDLLLSTLSTPSLRRPITPSIATLVNPLTSWVRLLLGTLRTIFLVLLSRLPGSEQAVMKISVANTSILYHDGRALATCESGPPLRVTLPSLETVGWYNGKKAEGEPGIEDPGEVLGGRGIFASMKEWTTAHPRVDPNTNELLLFSSMFFAPFVHYSIIPATQHTLVEKQPPRLLNVPVPGIGSAKMMHDFGVSQYHTVIMDLPLSLDPFQKIFQNKPTISYDLTKPSRFGVFPRRDPSSVRWFETSACCIFHTANTWDVLDNSGNLNAVDMLACRMTSATIVFSAGNVAAPQPTSRTTREVKRSISWNGTVASNFRIYGKSSFVESRDVEGSRLLQSSADEPNEPALDDHPIMEADECHLYYYSFAMDDTNCNTIAHQFSLSAIEFEFSAVRRDREMCAARYIYGCSLSSGRFGSALGRVDKSDILAKLDVTTLIARGKANPPRSVVGCVDTRTVPEIQASSSKNISDPIQVFQTPSNVYVQEPRFVASSSGTAEDDGYLLTYVFDEAQLTPEGNAPPGAVSELWIIDAKGMKDVLAKVRLPQRVPYGLHGNWFPESQVLGQRPVDKVRRIKRVEDKQRSLTARISQNISNRLISAIGG